MYAGSSLLNKIGKETKNINIEENIKANNAIEDFFMRNVLNITSNFGQMYLLIIKKDITPYPVPEAEKIKIKPTDIDTKFC